MEAARSAVGASLGVAGDLSGPGAARELIARAEAELGRVDCLVNNVGLAVQVGFDQLGDDDWEAMWQLNVMSYVRAIQAALPGMREPGLGPDRQRQLDRRQAAVHVDARLQRDQGRRALALTPRRRPLRGRRHPLQRGDPRPDGDRGLAGGRRPRRSGGGAVGQEQRGGPGRVSPRAARWDAWPSPRRSPPWSSSCARTVPAIVTGSAWSADGGTVPIII